MPSAKNTVLRAVVVINAYTSLKSELHQPYAIAEALNARGVETDVLRNGLFPARLEQNTIACEWAEQYDFCVYLDKDKYLSKLLERAGMRLFNSSDAVEVCDDKLLTSIALSGIAPMPRTLPAPLCYTPRIREGGDARPRRTVAGLSHGRQGMFRFSGKRRSSRP